MKLDRAVVLGPADKHNPDFGSRVFYGLEPNVRIGVYLNDLKGQKPAETTLGTYVGDRSPQTAGVEPIRAFIQTEDNKMYVVDSTSFHSYLIDLDGSDQLGQLDAVEIDVATSRLGRYLIATDLNYEQRVIGPIKEVVLESNELRPLSQVNSSPAFVSTPNAYSDAAIRLSSLIGQKMPIPKETPDIVPTGSNQIIGIESSPGVFKRKRQMMQLGLVVEQSQQPVDVFKAIHNDRFSRAYIKTDDGKSYVMDRGAYTGFATIADFDDPSTFERPISVWDRAGQSPIKIGEPWTFGESFRPQQIGSVTKVVLEYATAVSVREAQRLTQGVWDKDVANLKGVDSSPGYEGPPGASLR